jgi:hypothetical protein
MKMFHWSRENLSEEDAQAPEKYRKRGDRGNGGWSTKRSFDGLVRRLLHAMMTQDTFTVVSKYLERLQRVYLETNYFAFCQLHFVVSVNSLSRTIKRSGWS